MENVFIITVVMIDIVICFVAKGPIQYVEGEPINHFVWKAVGDICDN